MGLGGRLARKSKWILSQPSFGADSKILHQRFILIEVDGLMINIFISRL